MPHQTACFVNSLLCCKLHCPACPFKQNRTPGFINKVTQTDFAMTHMVPHKWFKPPEQQLSAVLFPCCLTRKPTGSSPENETFGPSCLFLTAALKASKHSRFYMICGENIGERKNWKREILPCGILLLRDPEVSQILSGLGKILRALRK